ncbi:hypothetical protein HCG45_21140 [Pseudomonas fulva]|uniref:hypothetical protein n=1 Tax=Pseudomonas fulva TaxID=47880 RepID=UPI001428D42E|nr:hypothetical protein [Pseudomonas fulva]NIX95244.1 hypothetical protein [Pseudomonas fulva]
MSNPSRQGLAPLQLEYQQLLAQATQCATQRVRVHETGFSSAVVNTDALGFRYSHFNGRRFSVAERDSTARVNLLVGGSVAMGIGASSDEYTVASQLSALTGELWLSLAGCGLDASQELLMFLTHEHRLAPLGHVVILSGLNSLAHEALWDISACSHEPQQINARQTSLGGSEQAQAAPQPGLTLWQRLSQVLAPPTAAPRPHRPFDALSPAEKRTTQAADHIARSVQQWDRLLGSAHTTLTFILQPLVHWCRESLPAGEQVMLSALQQTPGHIDRLLEGVFDRKVHAAFFRRIREQAAPVPCFDMNCMLDSSPAFGSDLFIDRLHLNDMGQTALANVITAKLGLAREKPLPASTL